VGLDDGGARGRGRAGQGRASDAAERDELVAGLLGGQAGHRPAGFVSTLKCNRPELRFRLRSLHSVFCKVFTQPIRPNGAWPHGQRTVAVAAAALVHQI